MSRARDALVELIHELRNEPAPIASDEEIVERIMPIVCRYADQRAAEELRAASRDVYHSRGVIGSEAVADWLYDRADALTTEASE